MVGEYPDHISGVEAAGVALRLLPDCILMAAGCS